jgi:hypothetical protein
MEAGGSPDGIAAWLAAGARVPGVAGRWPLLPGHSGKNFRGLGELRELKWRIRQLSSREGRFRELT